MKCRRLLLALLTVCLCAGLFALTALAEEPAYSGECGAKLKWELSADGCLTISGTGKMKDYTLDAPAPWNGAYVDVNVKKLVIEPGVTGIGECAFAYCGGLKELELPDTITSIGEGAFMATGITEFAIPEGFKTVPAGLFTDCGSMVAVTIPDSVTEIGGSAFYGCRKLAEIRIPASVKTIGHNAFTDCTSLTELVLPDGITTISA